MLQDRIVCGCRDKKVQYKLLADATLTFEKALTTATTETAERGAKNLSGHGASLNRLSDSRRRQPLRQLSVVVQHTLQLRASSAPAPATTARSKGIGESLQEEGPGYESRKTGFHSSADRFR
jgi:hypothetical protein